MNKRAERIINKIYQELFKKIFTKQQIIAGSKGNYSSIATSIFQIQNSAVYNNFAKRFSKKLAIAGLSKQKGLWRKYYNAAKIKHIVTLPNTFSEYEYDLMKKAVEENFKMIKSIPVHILETYKQKAVQTVIQQVAEGSVGRKTFETVLKKHGAKNARIIARTESAKLQTSIDESRATSLGSVCYEWLSANDKRTRPSHRAMNGVIVFWRQSSQKPLLDNMRGNAGEFPNCRCSPLPILNESDIINSSYKVYDYRDDKIIILTKAKLIECIKKGGL